MTTTSWSNSLMALRPGGASQHLEADGEDLRVGLGFQEGRTGDREATLHAHGLRLGVAVDALRALAPTEAGVPHAAHRRVDAAERGGEALVDVDRAGLDGGGDAA